MLPFEYTKRDTPNPYANQVENCPLIFDKPSICPECKQDKLELLSYRNFEQSFKKAADYYMDDYDIEFKYEIRDMVCKNCGTHFTISWDRGFPRPIIISKDNDYNPISNFYKSFIKDGIKSKKTYKSLRLI